jgi:putative ABC transport system substrate-binding protein
MVPEFGGKWVELLHELAPRASRIAVLWNPLNGASQDLVRAVRQAAGPLGLSLLSQEARRPEDFPVAFDAITQQEPDALIVDTAVLLISHRKSIVNSPPRIGSGDVRLARFVDEGRLISYGPTPSTFGVAPPVMSTRSLKVPNPPICRFSSRRNSAGPQSEDRDGTG